jgi:legumain
MKSGPNDNVFVFFADHGAPGIIAFPNGQAVRCHFFSFFLTEKSKSP